MTDATKTAFKESMVDVPFMDRVEMRTRGKYVVELAHGFKPDCPHCGCYYTVSFQVRDPELNIWEEV